MRSVLSSRAMARGDLPVAKAAKMRRTTAASVSSIDAPAAYRARRARRAHGRHRIRSTGRHRIGLGARGLQVRATPSGAGQ